MADHGFDPGPLAEVGFVFLSIFVSGIVLLSVFCGTMDQKGADFKVDPETGCEYLCVFYGLAGCTPRLGPDAKPICKGPQK